MTMSIITALMPLVIKLITMYLKKSNADLATQKKFFTFIDAMEKGSAVTSKLRKKYTQQKDRVSSMIKEIEAKEGVK